MNQVLLAPENLLKYSLWWSLARLIFASVALLLNAVPVLIAILPVLSLTSLAPLVGMILKISWIISGAAATYLLYRWLNANQMIFGRKNRIDTMAFFVMIVSGLNLGITGLTNYNLGLNITTLFPILVIVALIYLASAYHLFKESRKFGYALF